MNAKLFPFLNIWIFIHVCSVKAKISILWTKYQWEEENVQAECALDENRFTKDDVFDSVSCGRLCYEDNVCTSVFFHPENHLCFGCQTFVKFLPKNKSTGFLHFLNRKLEIDCKEILERNSDAKSGLYEVMFGPSGKIQVHCDMVTNFGGWTVFQNRFDGSVDFKRTFSEYENGFGDLNGEFWLGLKFIQEITKAPSEISIEFKLDDEGFWSERYDGFQVLGSQYNLSIDVSSIAGTGLNNPFKFHNFNGASFATIDQDSKFGCANISSGGWWYLNSHCEYPTNLNIIYGKSNFNSSIMMVRRI